jgi:hypothetical protein
VTRLRPLLLVLAAVAVGIAVGLVVLARDDEPPARQDGVAMRVRTEIEPSVALFAEPVTVEADVLVDPALVEPDSVRLDARVEPFRLVSRSRVQTAAGDLERVRFRLRLACAAAACAPSDETSEVDIPAASIVYDRRESILGAARAVRVQDTVIWPTVKVASRLGAFDLERARWRADLAELPPVSERITPGALGALLLGGSALLALLAAGLLATQLGVRRRAVEQDEPPPRATPLELALAGVTASSANGAGDDRSRSLERLARELSATGRGELAARARRLAWSPRRATRTDVDSLAADVRAVIEEQRWE